jgi:NADH dehydrogenase/NADH:ubiquinone oxidoreductase subunit G
MPAEAALLSHIVLQRLSPVGSCRLCMVVKGTTAKPLPAHLPVSMDISAETPAVVGSRRMVLELL